MKNVYVMNRLNALNYCTHDHDERFGIISVSTPDEDNISIMYKRGLISILHLKFADMDNELGITDKQVNQIVDHVLTWNKMGVENIIVHCDAGISRSAGIAAAILKYLTGDDSQIFNNSKYIPNMKCYRKVLNAFMERSNN